MSASRKHFLVVWLAVTVPSFVAFMVSTHQFSWLWAGLISAALGCVSAVMLTATASGNFKAFYLSGLMFGVGIGAFTRFPLAAMFLGWIIYGLVIVAIGIVASHWFTGKRLAATLIAGGVGFGLVCYIELEYWIYLPFGLRDLKLPYYVLISGLAAYTGYRMLNVRSVNASTIQSSPDTSSPAERRGSGKNFLIVWLAVTLSTAVVFMLCTIQDLWPWAILTSAGLGLLSGFVLTSTIPRIIKTLYVSGYIFAIGVGTFSSYPPVTIPISGAYMGVAVSVIGVVVRRWLTGRWLATVLIVCGAGIGIAYNVLFGDYMFYPPLGWDLKLPYCAAVGALAAYLGYRMLTAPREITAITEPAARVDIASIPSGTTVTPRAADTRDTTAIALLLGSLAITICAGMAAALGISNLVGKGLFATWESLGIPATSANQVTGASWDWVTVRTAENTNYRLGLGYDDQNAVWTKIDTAGTASTGGCGPLKSSSEMQRFHEDFSLLSIPPNVTGEPYVVKCLAPESTWVIVYVVNNQGEVLRWRSPEGFEALGQALNWGLLGGIGLGLALAAVLMVRRSRSKTS